MELKKKYCIYTTLLVVFFILLLATPFQLFGQTTCETKIECIRESREKKQQRIESGEIDTTPSSTHEYTYNVEYKFMVSDGDTVWDEIRNAHDKLTPDTLDQWFENERIDVLNALKTESRPALKVMGFSSGSIDLIYPKEIICFRALHRNKRVIEEGVLIKDSDIVYDIESCK